MDASTISKKREYIIYAYFDFVKFDNQSLRTNRVTALILPKFQETAYYIASSGRSLRSLIVLEIFKTVTDLLKSSAA